MSLSRTSVWSAQSPTMTTRRCHASLENALLASGPVPSLLLQKTAWMCLMLTAPKPLTMCYPSWAQIRPVPYPGMVTLTRVHSVSLGQSASPLCRNTLRSIKVLLGVIGFLDVTLMSSSFFVLCSSLESGTAVKGGSLSAQFPQRSDGKELKILVQPETQHRARYLTEGSRGSVKDRTQQGFPTVKVGVKKLPAAS